MGGKKQQNNYEFACKVLPKTAYKLFPTLSLAHQNEIDIVRGLDHHANVTGLFEHFEDTNYIYMILTYGSRGSMFDVLDAQDWKISEGEVRVYLRQILSGLNHIHASRVIHCDIKLENVFVDARGRARIGDFGLSVRYDGDAANANGKMVMPNRGTSIYLAPESITRSVMSYKTDIWAFAVLAYIVKTTLPPFDGLDDEQTFELIKSIEYM